VATPLIKISDKIYAKLETYQPTGSVKDRMVSYLVEDAFKNNKIQPGRTKFIEATSGNTGISLASQAAKYACPCVIIMPRNMSEQRKQMMRAFGAHIIEVGDNDFKGAIQMRDNLIARSKPGKAVWCPYQFENPLNVKCHFEITADEICTQVAEQELRWDAFVHGAGTGGTMMGIKQYIDHHDLGIKCVLTMPAEAASDHGIQGINDGADFLLDRRLMDNAIRVETCEAISRMKKFAQESGLLVGISSGANIAAAEAYVETFNPSGVVVTMLCDRGERYL
jgi:cysteine synthase A